MQRISLMPDAKIHYSQPRRIRLSTFKRTHATQSDRPALIMVDQGEVFENSRQCTVPILHKANEIYQEST